MDKATVIELAREAGAEFAELPMTDAIVFSVDDRAWNSAALHRFAALVAAHEREACAKVCEELELKSADGQLGTYIAGWSDGTDDCAAAIRSRT